MAGISTDMVPIDVPGHRCDRCGYPVLSDRPACPNCGGRLLPATFTGEGAVWSATVVRIDVPGHPAPRVLAYVDLNDGPRILAAVNKPDGRPPRPGAQVEVTDATSNPISIRMADS